MDKPVVAVKDLNFWFGSGEASKQALFDINLELPRGSLTVLMGPSGSGKTTLLTLIGCLRSIHEGSINLLDQELNGASHEKLTSIRQRLGFIFQAHNLHESLTAIQNVVMGVQVRSGVSDELAYKAAEQALHLVGLSSRLHYLPANLSGGQKQRISIARAILKNSSIILLDEATSALDTESEAIVQQAMNNLSENKTTITIAHRLSTIKNSDLIYVIEDGTVVESGSHDDLILKNGAYKKLCDQQTLN